MLGLYLYSLKIGHTSCKMLNIPINTSNGIAKWCDKIVLDKKVKTQHQQNKTNQT